MKAAIIGITVVLIAGGAAYYFLHAPTVPAYVEQKEAPGMGVVGSPSKTDPFDFTITFTDDGITAPSDITVKQGERVRFLNSSSMQVWPASGVHPTHTLYPEKEPGDCLGSAFDACQGLLPGDYFDFTFNYLGRWPYHDHLHAYNTGSITVAP